MISGRILARGLFLAFFGRIEFSKVAEKFLNRRAVGAVSWRVAFGQGDILWQILVFGDADDCSVCVETNRQNALVGDRRIKNPMFFSTLSDVIPGIFIEWRDRRRGSQQAQDVRAGAFPGLDLGDVFIGDEVPVYALHRCAGACQAEEEEPKENQRKFSFHDA